MKKLDQFISEQMDQEIERGKLVSALKADSLNAKEIAEKFNVPIAIVEKSILELIEQKTMLKNDSGYYSITTEPEPPKKLVLNHDMWDGEWLRFGYTSDNHLGSNFERLDVLNLAYDVFEKEGIKIVLNGGNWIEGEARFNKHEIHKHGFGNQMKYAAEVFPYKKGIETWFISGDDHEGWYNQREGIDSGEYMQHEREKLLRFDMKHLGYVEADINLNDGTYENPMWMRIVHPGGGSSYATSYAPQKIIESYQPGEKPHILMVGHYHKSGCEFIRGVHCVQMATTKDQDIFMRKKKLEAHLGFGMIEIMRNSYGHLVRFKHEFIPMYDKGFYVGNDKYWK